MIGPLARLQSGRVPLQAGRPEPQAGDLKLMTGLEQSSERASPDWKVMEGGHLRLRVSQEMDLSISQSASRPSADEEEYED